MTDKSNILCVLKILEDYSDPDHPLPRKAIEDKFDKLYDRSIDRRTLYGAMDALEDFGYDISRYEDNGIGYYIIDRKFTSAEMKLLIDAVYSCEYISQKQTEELLEKLRSFLSVHERKKFNYTNIIAPDKKTPNAEVFLNIEILEEAINEQKKISFTYLDYSLNMKLVPRRDRPYVASPYSMICKDNHYYLILIYEGHTDPSFYRIDMMKNIQILDEKIEITKKEAKLDSLKRVVYAHSGEPEKIHLHCKKSVLRYVIEDFGKDVMINDCPDDDYFDAIFTAPPQGLLYWALKYLNEAEVIEPESVREKVINAIKNNKYIQ